MAEPIRDPQMTIVAPPRNRGGRPRDVQQGASVTAWIEVKHYDQLVKLATAQEKSVSTLVRELLVMRLQ